MKTDNFHRAGVFAVLLLFSIAISSLINFTHLGASSLFGDEAIYATAAHNIATDKQWYPLVYQHAIYSRKPPLAVWPVAASFKIFGETELAARLPSAVSGVLAVAFTFICAMCVLGPWFGFVAAIIFATCPLWVADHGARAGVADPMLCLLLLIALAAYQRHAETSLRKWLAIACAATALSSLCKGLVGPVFVFVAAAANQLICVRDRLTTDGTPHRTYSLATLLRSLRVPLLLLFAGVATYLPWVIDNLARTPQFAEWLYQDAVVRIASGVDPLHVQGVMFYPGELVRAFGWLDLLLLLAGACIALRNVRDARDRALRFVAVAGIVILALAQFSASKLTWYIIPALPAFAILIAVGARAVLARLQGNRSHWIVVAGVMLFTANHVRTAWQYVGAAPLALDMHVLTRALREIPDANFYSENFERPEWGDSGYFRAWNQFYLEQVERFTLPVPDRLPATGCHVVLTDQAQQHLGQSGFGRAVVIPLRKFDEREATLSVIDLCDGRIAARLRGS